MPRIGLVVLTSIFRLFILDVGLKLLVGFVPEHQQTVRIGRGGHGEKDVVSLQVREGPVGNNQVIMSSAHTHGVGTLPAFSTMCTCDRRWLCRNPLETELASREQCWSLSETRTFYQTDLQKKELTKEVKEEFKSGSDIWNIARNKISNWKGNLENQEKTKVVSKGQQQVHKNSVKIWRQLWVVWSVNMCNIVTLRTGSTRCHHHLQQQKSHLNWRQRCFWFSQTCVVEFPFNTLQNSSFYKVNEFRKY